MDLDPLLGNRRSVSDKAWGNHEKSLLSDFRDSRNRLYTRRFRDFEIEVYTTSISKYENSPTRADFEVSKFDLHGQISRLRNSVYTVEFRCRNMPCTGIFRRSKSTLHEPISNPRNLTYTARFRGTKLPLHETISWIAIFEVRIAKRSGTLFFEKRLKNDSKTTHR